MWMVIGALTSGRKFWCDVCTSVLVVVAASLVYPLRSKGATMNGQDTRPSSHDADVRRPSPPPLFPRARLSRLGCRWRRPWTGRRRPPRTRPACRACWPSPRSFAPSTVPLVLPPGVRARSPSRPPPPPPRVGRSGKRRRTPRPRHLRRAGKRARGGVRVRVRSGGASTRMLSCARTSSTGCATMTTAGDLRPAAPVLLCLFTPRIWSREVDLAAKM